jgi:hypothetical protein
MPMSNNEENKLNNIFELSKLGSDGILKLILEVIENKTWCIKHPISNVPTILRASKKISMVNVLKFSDENLENVWYIIQRAKFFEGVLVDGEFLITSGNTNVVAIRSLIENGELTFNDNGLSTVDGIIFSSRRPYHFLYDQYVNVFSLIEQSSLIKEHLYTDSDCYYNEFPEGNKFKIADEDGCYLMGVTTGNLFDSGQATKMNTYLKSNITDVDHINEELVVWLGITGQKRTWFEQVEGYYNIVKSLSAKYDSILVIVDGWTSKVNKTERIKDDLDVYENLSAKLNEIHNVKIISVIGNNYKSKISYCRYVDYFIANAGGGSMVPLNFSNAKGVLHTNGRVNAFKIKDGMRIKIVPEKYITSEDSGIAMNDSYSICWKVIYKLIDELMIKSI